MIVNWVEARGGLDSGPLQQGVREPANKAEAVVALLDTDEGTFSTRRVKKEPTNGKQTEREGKVEKTMGA